MDKNQTHAIYLELRLNLVILNFWKDKNKKYLKKLKSNIEYFIKKINNCFKIYRNKDQRINVIKMIKKYM